MTLKNIKYLFIFTFILAIAGGVFANSEGPNNAGTGTNYPLIGTIAWVSPEHITQGSDYYTFAYDIPYNNGATRYLKGTNYNFHIPSNAIIDGIEVKIRCVSSGTETPYLRDNVVKLVKYGDIVGENKAITDTDWPINYMGIRTYGGDDDLWGENWTPAEINDLDFGVVLSAINPNTAFTRYATVDYMQIKVYYTIDTMSPVFDSYADITAEATSSDGTNVEFYLPTATDNIDGDVDVVCDYDSGDLFPLGQTEVNCTATDDSNNESYMSFTITVEDTISPVFNSYADITAEATSSNGANVDFDLPIATDLVDSNVEVFCNANSGDLFALGDTTVTCNAEDASGNAADPITFTINVEDTTAPVITLLGNATVIVTKRNTYIDAGAIATDLVDGNLDVNIITINPVDTSILGTYVITYNVMDASGNAATEVTRIVTVVKNGRQKCNKNNNPCN